VIRFLTFRGRTARDSLLLFLFFTGLGMAALRHHISELPLWPGPLGDPYKLIHAAPWRIAIEAVYDLLLMMVAVARLHDFDRRGWWALGFIALAAAASGTALAPVPWASFASLAIGYLALPTWLVLLAWPGGIGPNRFGPDPRGWQSTEQYAEQAKRLAEERASYFVYPRKSAY
jgi:uncharacterized membrane protein YhaH (DUF805 family)